MTPELTDELRRLVQMVNNGTRPHDLSPFKNVLDMSKGLGWNMPDLHQAIPPILPIPAAVNTRGITWRHSGSDLGSGSLEMPLKSEQRHLRSIPMFLLIFVPLILFNHSGTAVFAGRRKQRNATGFAKFNMAELQAMELADEEDDDANGTSYQFGASSAKSIMKQDDGHSSSGSQTFKLKSQHSSIDESRVIEIEVTQLHR